MPTLVIFNLVQFREGAVHSRVVQPGLTVLTSGTFENAQLVWTRRSQGNEFFGGTHATITAEAVTHPFLWVAEVVHFASGTIS